MVMKQWLDNHGITYDSKDLKKDFFKLIQSCNATTVYQTDCIAARYGHEVVRLPIAHCEFNPIEMAWSIVKDYIMKNNTTFKLTDAQALIPLAFHQVTGTVWERLCEHVKKVKDEYWSKDSLIEEAVEEFIVTVGGPDSDDSDEEYEDDYIHSEDYSYDEPEDLHLVNDDDDLRLLYEERLRELMDQELEY